jgi:nucleotide sugar dehydrogenase
MKQKIGFIGQGWIGKHYADNFEERGYETVRFALEAPYKSNKNKIKDCKITIIAVPTPTTPEGFDDSILKDSLTNIGDGNIAVIKSTTLPGVAAKLQSEFPEIIVLHSPEFLVEKTAAHDAANPDRNIIGITADTEEQRQAAENVMSVLPEAPYQVIMSSMESELVKYAGNCFLYTKVLFMNTLYDVVVKSGADYDKVKEALVNDPRIGASHTQPVHDSGHTESLVGVKRGAGGHCFIKDFEAYRKYYQELSDDNEAINMLTAMAKYNNHLLINSDKDIDLLRGVYGSSVVKGDEELR